MAFTTNPFEDQYRQRQMEEHYRHMSMQQAQSLMGIMQAPHNPSLQNREASKQEVKEPEKKTINKKLLLTRSVK